MKSAAFNEAVATIFTQPLKTVTVYARFLKEAGLMTTGGRGRSAPEMTPLDGARMIIALLTTCGPSQCVDRVKRFGKIPFSPSFRKVYRGYETMPHERFEELFEGETLEEVLAYLISLPAKQGINVASRYFFGNGFHLRINDFDVLAELFQDKREDGEIVGELVVPFKGKIMMQGSDGFAHVAEHEPILGGIRTERLCIAMQIFELGCALARDREELRND